jgi:two-component system, NarL family, nitrate/nitrite response regulator NarL
MHVLLVDAHIMFREGLRVLLSNEPDIEVVGDVGTSEEALDLALTLEPDIILLDANLSDDSGLNLLTTLQLRLPDTRLVILTNKAEDDLLINAIRLGAKGVILKSLSVSKLIASIRGLERGEMALSRSMATRVLEKFVSLHNQTGPNLQDDGLDQLSKREREVLVFLSRGDSNREIAKKLVISENTVKKHVHNILEKLNQKNRNQVSRLARQSLLQDAEDYRSDYQNS